MYKFINILIFIGSLVVLALTLYYLWLFTLFLLPTH